MIPDGFMRTAVIPVHTPRAQVTGFLDDEMPNNDPPAYDELRTDYVELPESVSKLTLKNMFI